MRGAVIGAVVPGLPHPLLVPERNEGWARVRAGFAAARKEILAAKPDLLLIYSTMWPSVVGHQIQADPMPEWIHVDELFHDLGSIPYRFPVDAEFSHAYCDAAEARGLHARTVAYHGFPIDTGSVVALKLLDPKGEIPASIVSSNMYSDRAETLVLGKAACDALEATGRRAAAIVVTTLSNRLFTEFIDPKEDRIHSEKDDEWNRKVLEFLADGRLEDVAQLSREIHRQIRVRKVVNFKPMWWLSAVLGRHNGHIGKVHAYEPVYGTGSAVVTLTPSAAGVGDKEYDEEDVEVYSGDRHVLERGGSPPGGASLREGRPGSEGGARSPARSSEGGAGPSIASADGGSHLPHGEVAQDGAPPAQAPLGSITTSEAPAPVGAYPHARRVGDLLFLSGIGPRTPKTDEIPGGPVRDGDGNPLDYDAEAQTRAVIRNVTTILEASGAELTDVLDVTVFLIDMDRDFDAMNRVYREHFESVGATRTTLAVSALPTPIAVEFKVIARARNP